MISRNSKDYPSIGHIIDAILAEPDDDDDYTDIPDGPPTPEQLKAIIEEALGERIEVDMEQLKESLVD